MQLRLFHFLVLFFTLTCGFLSDNPTHAQSAQNSQQQPHSYQAAILDNDTSDIDFAGKSYVLKEGDTHFDVNTVEAMVRNGDMLSHLNRETHINLGTDSRGTWIILPIINKGTNDAWTLSLGSFGTGRFNGLKDIIVHRMGEIQPILDTTNTSTHQTNLPPHLQITVPKNQTSFLILYLKPNIAGLSFVLPKLERPNQNSFFQLFSSWLPIILSFGAFLYFIKLPNDKTSYSDIYTGLVWLGISVQLLLTSNFLYIGQFETELASPLIWIFISLMMMLSLISLENCREQIPTSLFSGTTSLLLIFGLAGIITLRVFLVFF